MRTWMVTGGAGFIGNNFVRLIIEQKNVYVVNLDKLTYAGNLESLTGVLKHPRHSFVQGDIGDQALVGKILRKYRPEIIVNFAAESHVDRSIDGPGKFIQTNIVGTFNLLEEIRRYWQENQEKLGDAFRFLHVSTDEVYGSLGQSGYFTENTPYAPNSPYSASKASSDFLVRAYYHTYGLPTLTTNCSNNYGPFQFPEKLIPLMILNAIEGDPLPIYGEGKNIRDWLYVLDHCRAIQMVVEQGIIGETYNIGGHNERSNLEVVQFLCKLLDELAPRKDGKSYREQITFVKDRPGHDLRYAIDSSKIQRMLNWKPQETFETGLRKTVRWYLENPTWCYKVTMGSYQRQRVGGEGN